MPANPILPQLTLPGAGDQPLSSSTESAHHDDSGSSLDKLSSRSPSKRRSKIPLKAYSAPKPPDKPHDQFNAKLCDTRLPDKGSSVVSSIPKYGKDSSWHSTQSRKSAESLSHVPPSGGRNWDTKPSQVAAVVKKPAILSNKEMSLASRRDSPRQVETRLRKSSTESSSHSSSGSSPRYARDVAKLRAPRPPPGDTKVRPATKISNFLTSWIKSSGLS